MDKTNILNIDYKILAKHFDKSRQSMHKLKQKHDKGLNSLWTIYIKAYNWDTREG